MAMETRDANGEIGEIQRQMAQIRQELHHDVRGAVRGAQSLTNWRNLVGRHPWLALGIAVATGYLIVPRRRREAPAAVSAGGAAGPDLQPTPLMPARPRRQPGWNALQSAYSLLAPVAVRAAQNYALQHLERWLAAHSFALPQSPPATEESLRSDRTDLHSRGAIRLFDT
jgi:hypothetical protein